MLTQHAVLTQPKQTPARNGHILRMNGVPSAKPHGFQVCVHLHRISQSVILTHVGNEESSMDIFMTSSLIEISRSIDKVR